MGSAWTQSDANFWLWTAWNNSDTSSSKVRLDSWIRLADMLFSENIETVRKDRVFDSEITEDEMEIIAKRVALQQQQVGFTGLL